MRALLPKLKFVSDATVALNLIFFEVIEQPSTLPDEIEQPTTRRIVIRMLLKVLREAFNPLRKDCNLYLRGSRVVWSVAEPVYKFLFLFLGNHCAGCGYLFRLCHAKEETAILAQFRG